MLRRLKLLAPETLVDPVFRLVAAGRLFGGGRFPVSTPVPPSARPIFIVGSGRSGNTLLRSMLCAHPEIGIPPEFGGFRSAYRQYTIYNHLPWRALVAVVLARIEATESFSHWTMSLNGVQASLLELPPDERSFAAIITEVYAAYVREHFEGSSLWGDKTPLNAFNLARIHKTFPTARYIHMLRDGRDVAASFLKANLRSATSLEAAAYHWRDATRRVTRHFANSDRARACFEVRYEDLVADPQDVLATLCEFLELPFDQAMLEHNKVFERMGDTHLAHHENVSKGVSTRSIGKWKNAFDEPQRAKLMTIIGKDLEAFGYGDV